MADNSTYDIQLHHYLLAGLLILQKLQGFSGEADRGLEYLKSGRTAMVTFQSSMQSISVRSVTSGWVFDEELHCIKNLF